jgi:hypothetical protein
MTFHKPNIFYLFKKDYVTKPTPNAWRLSYKQCLHKLYCLWHFVVHRNQSDVWIQAPPGYVSPDIHLHLRALFHISSCLIVMPRRISFCLLTYSTHNYFFGISVDSNRINKYAQVCIINLIKLCVYVLWVVGWITMYMQVMFITVCRTEPLH